MPTTDFDWDAEWKRARAGRTAAFSQDFWNNKAPSYRTEKLADDYSRDFLTYAKIEEGWSVLDAGCGSGVFAIPLALEGHRIIALDFSTRMLKRLQNETEKHGVQGRITPIFGSWEDDWERLGILPASVDICIASRSFLTHELNSSLLKLDTTARRRVCLTANVSSFPYHDATLVAAMGHEHSSMGDYQLVLGALEAMGIKADLHMIGAERRDVYLNTADARKALLRSLGHLSKDEEALLDAFMEEHLIPWNLSSQEYEYLCQKDINKELGVDAQARGDSDSGVHLGVAKDYLRDTRWAFISWDK